MKIAFGMIVCNGDDFLEQCLNQVLDFADQIVIAEGATETWMKALGWETPESKDRTNLILTKFDKYKKVHIAHGQWLNKIAQSNGYMRFIDDDVDYIWQLDSDEFYFKKDLEKTADFLNKEYPTYVTVKQRHFWKNFHTIAVGQRMGWGWETPQPRIQKYYPGCLYLEHRPPMILNPESGIKNSDIKSMNLLKETGIWCYHYNYVTDKQVCEKMAYYAEEFPQVTRLKTWYEFVWKKWDYDKNMIESLYGTHPSAWQGSCTQPYDGPHPEEIEKCFLSK